jgi:hypothetical protein
MVFNAPFNNISALLWQSVLLVEETGGPRENHWPVTSHWQTCLLFIKEEFVDTKGVIKINEIYVKKKFVRSYGSWI